MANNKPAVAIWCIQCGALKRETNHWFAIHPLSSAGKFSFQAFNGSVEYKSGVVSVCGRECLGKQIETGVERMTAVKVGAMTEADGNE